MKLRSSSSSKDEESEVLLSNEVLQDDMNNLPERRTGTNTIAELLAENNADNIELDALWKRLYNSHPMETCTSNVTSSAERFQQVQKYVIPSQQGFLKVVPHRIYSVAFAKTAKPLAFAGDKWGYLGIWAPLQEDENCLTLQPHIRAISKIFCHTSLNDQIITCSYDGTVRMLSLNHSKYETISDIENMLFYDISCLDNGNSFLVATNAGQLIFIDKRDIPSSKAITLHDRKISSVDAFPDQHTFCTCSHSLVCEWDFRKLSLDIEMHSSPIQTRTHSKAVTAARVSPCGNFILTTCYDNYLRVFESSKKAPTSKDALLYKIPHNNNTGRWITPFVAEWDAQCDHLFYCASMKKPRGIDLFHMGKTLETNRLVQENLTSIIPRLAIHPTTGMIIGGSSSGRVFAFADYNPNLS